LDRFDSINPTRLARCFNGGHAAVTVLRARDLVAVDVNDVFEALTGVTRAMVVGKNLVDFGIWQDDQQFRSVSTQLRDAKHLLSTPVSFHCADGNFADGLLMVESFQFAGTQFLLTITQDVRRYSYAEDAMQRPLNGYASFFQDADQGFYRLWPKQRGLIEVNRRFAAILGYDQSLAKRCIAPLRQ
jgi:PAS domain S-box-containing protein